MSGFPLNGFEQGKKNGCLRLSQSDENDRAQDIWIDYMHWAKRDWKKPSKLVSFIMQPPSKTRSGTTFVPSDHLALFITFIRHTQLPNTKQFHSMPDILGRRIAIISGQGKKTDLFISPGLFPATFLRHLITIAKKSRKEVHREWEDPHATEKALDVEIAMLSQALQSSSSKARRSVTRSVSRKASRK